MKKCDLCNKEVETTKKSKLINENGHEVVLNVCDECMDKYDLEEYDGSDVHSDWN